jgi:hypothetical protein
LGEGFGGRAVRRSFHELKETRGAFPFGSAPLIARKANRQ